MIIGEKIIVSKFLFRNRTCRQIKDSSLYEVYKHWDECTFSGNQLKEVYVIGIRYLSNGIAHNNKEESFFEPTERFKAFLVVESLYTKPFYVKCN